MWYEINLDVLKAKMAEFQYPPIVEVMTDGLNAFIWAEWDEEEQRFDIQHFTLGHRMGEWNEPYGVFGLKLHDNSDEITLGMLENGEIFSFGTFTECKFPKTRNVFEEFIPEQISRRFSVLASDGGIYETLTLSEDGESQRFICLSDGDGSDLIKFEEFTAHFCRMARSEYIYAKE